jgi:predicted nuclease of restriction endonuclease-like (RecB) superfamily
LQYATGEENKIAKKKPQALVAQPESAIDEAALFERVSSIIEKRKARAGSYANREVTLMYWEVGEYINSVELGGERAAYGKNILSTLSTKLMYKYGKSFYLENIYRMMRCAKVFPNPAILSTASTKLSWSHICEIIRVKTEEGRLYYANDAAERNLGVMDLRKQISRKAFERQEIANSQLTAVSAVPFNSFKDPFLLDVLDLKDNCLEADLEQAILDGLETFILEYGHGLTYSGKQKVMVMDGEAYKLDLLFYSRDLKRLVAIDLNTIVQ